VGIAEELAKGSLAQKRLAAAGRLGNPAAIAVLRQEVAAKRERLHLALGEVFADYANGDVPEDDAEVEAAFDAAAALQACAICGAALRKSNPTDICPACDLELEAEAEQQGG
jgi:hypothetical protein